MAIAIIAVVAVVMVSVQAQAAYARSAYESGYRNGCGDHIKGSWHLNFALSPDYGRGYEDGWASCR